jgi:hypothetical protein
MVLLIAEEGPLRAAIESELRDAEIPTHVAPADHDDLWLEAKGHEAIVYLPSASLLDGHLAPAPNPERMREVLGAAGAPGVEVVVPVFPVGEAWDAEVTVMKRHGRPYAALRAHPLLEEIAGLVPGDAQALLLPRIGRAAYCRAATVAAAVREAIRTEQQGRVSEVEAESSDVAALVQRAAEATHAPVRVRALWPWLFRLARPLFRWFRRREAQLLEALALLVPELAEPRPALPTRR